MPATLDGILLGLILRFQTTDRTNLADLLGLLIRMSVKDAKDAKLRAWGGGMERGCLRSSALAMRTCNPPPSG